MSEAEVRAAMDAAMRAAEEYQAQGTGREVIPAGHSGTVDPWRLGAGGHVTGLPFSPEVARALTDADKVAAREEADYLAAREEADYRAMTTAPLIRAEYQRRMIEAQAIERKAEAVRA